MRFLLLAVCWLLLSTTAIAAGPELSIVVGEKAPSPERLAAEELAVQLKKLYDAEVKIVTEAPAEGPAIFIGNPATNGPIAKLTEWPKLSDQGHVLRSVNYRNGTALILGGGSPVAAYWAVAEFGHRLGIRPMLFGDLFPTSPPEFTLAGYDVTLEPRIRNRSWQVLDALPSSGASWGLADQQRLLRQLAKLKYNHLVVYVHAWQPFVHFEHGGIKKETGILWYGWQFPVSGDTAGRSAFAGAKLFENPDFAGAKSYDERLKAGQTLIRGIIDAAHERGTTVGVTVNVMEFPKEFAPIVPKAQPVANSVGLAVTPAGSEATNKQAVTLATAQLLAYGSTYPKIDALVALKADLPSDAGEPAVLPQSYLSTLPPETDVAVRSQSIGDDDFRAYYLSRSSFAPDLTPSKALSDMLTPVCGEGVSDRVLKAMEFVERATSLVKQHDPEFSHPGPEMILKHYTIDEPVPEWWGQARDSYLAAMNEMYRANTRARDGGRAYTLYLARRYEFGFEYFNCVEAVRKAGLAKRKNDAETQVAELQKGVESIYGGLNALAAVARSQSDRGTIAMLNEFGYKPLMKELETAEDAQEQR